MVVLDVRPKVVDLYGYAGDTLTVAIFAPPAMISGKQWDAEVRLSQDSPTVSATFSIIPSTDIDVPTYITLDSETTRALSNGGTRMKVRRGKATYEILRFTGVYDCQISQAGNDPIRTLVQGLVMLDLDVTRIEP